MNDEADAEETPSASFLDEELIPALILLGVVLFLLPEPVTSTLGIVLVGLGVGMWLFDFFRQ